MKRSKRTPPPPAVPAVKLDAIGPALAAFARYDGWENLMTMMGVVGQDKAQAGTFRVDRISYQMAINLWRGDDMAARIAEAEPAEMLRKGYAFVPTLDGDGADEKAAELAALVAAKLSDLKTDARLNVALQNERATGGAALLMAAIDGQTDLAQPLNEDALQDIRALNFIPANRMRARTWQTDPMLPDYNEVELWEVSPRNGFGGATRLVHASRMLFFPGIRIDDEQIVDQNGIGDSVYNRVWRVLRAFNASYGGVEHLLTEFSVDMLKVKGLAELLSKNKEDVVVKRAKQARQARTIAGMHILDATEEYSRQTTSLAGLAEMMDRWANRLAAAADMPVTLLMGQAPAGLNATGASDVRFYYDRIAARQGIKLLPHLTRLVKLLLKSKQGPTRGVEPEKWEIRFNPLYQMSALETAQLRDLVATTDVKYITAGVTTNDEVAASRFGGEWSPETYVDFEARKALASADTPEEPKPPPTDAPAPDDGADTPPEPKAKTKAPPKGDSKRRR